MSDVCQTLVCSYSCVSSVFVLLTVYSIQKHELINPRNLFQLLLENFKNLLGTLVVVFNDPLSIVNEQLRMTVALRQSSCKVNNQLLFESLWAHVKRWYEFTNTNYVDAILMIFRRRHSTGISFILLCSHWAFLMEKSQWKSDQIRIHIGALRPFVILNIRTSPATMAMRVRYLRWFL